MDNQYQQYNNQYNPMYNNQNGNFPPSPPGDTKTCKYCQSPIDKKATVCPYCRKSQGVSAGCGCIVAIAVFILAFIIAFGVLGSAVKSNKSSDNASGSADRNNHPTTSTEASKQEAETKKKEVETKPLENDYNSNEEIASAVDSVYSAYLDSIADRKNELSDGKITIGKNTLSLTMKQIGEPDENGYPLYIGLRGGGNWEPDLAQEQYEVMQDYYSYAIKSGIYIVTQTLEFTWDEHYRPEMFPFYDRIIEDAAAFYNVDLNRVYLMGFSSGGDGVYAIAPRIADRFAAVNMSAGFPHTLRLGNLYNLPMCIQMGEKDTAYDRHLYAAKYDAMLNDYAAQYGGGFTHETFLHVNGDHNSWTDVLDYGQDVYTGDQVAVWLDDPSKAVSVSRNTSAVDWVNAYTRNPLPERIVWEPYINAGLRDSQAFYWLDRDADLGDSTIVASYQKSDNSVTIEQCEAERGTLKIYLNPQMLDVFQDVTVNICGKYSFTIRPAVSRQIMESTLEARGDKNLIFTSEIDITFNGNDAPDVYAVGSHSTEYTLKDTSNLIYWNKDGLFYVDQSLFGMSRKQLEDTLNIELFTPVTWEYWGNNLTFTAYDDWKEPVVFMFQDGRCVIIYSEAEGSISTALNDSAVKYFGQSDEAFVPGGLCRYFLENNVYDGIDHIRQMYMYYQYKEW